MHLAREETPIAPEVHVHEVRIEDLATCHAIRRTVFIEGQGVPEDIEVDGRDPVCRHVVAYVLDHAVGTARLRFTPEKAKAERVAVLQSSRGLGIGAILMTALEDIARQAGYATVHLHAQQAVVPFYEHIGYRKHGEVFYEADIPHLAMYKPCATP